MKPRQIKRFCTICGEVYHPRRDGGKYCSGKCRSKAYRERHVVPKTRSEIAIKRYQTKMQNFRLVTCVQCHESFLVNGLNSHRLYCKDSCKQRAYRERKAAKIHSLHVFPVAPSYGYSQAAR
jgi:hypothetical protein